MLIILLKRPVLGLVLDQNGDGNALFLEHALTCLRLCRATLLHRYCHDVDVSLTGARHHFDLAKMTLYNLDLFEVLPQTPKRRAAFTCPNLTLHGWWVIPI